MLKENYTQHWDSAVVKILSHFLSLILLFSHIHSHAITHTFMHKHTHMQNHTHLQNHTHTHTYNIQSHASFSEASECELQTLNTNYIFEHFLRTIQQQYLITFKKINNNFMIESTIHSAFIYPQLSPEDFYGFVFNPRASQYSYIASDCFCFAFYDVF